MGLAVRLMQQADIPKVSRLLGTAYGDRSAVYPHWEETLNWLYFSPEIKDGIPRAWVIDNGEAIVGHIGITVSEFTDGFQTYRLVQPTNWIVDPERKPGLLSIRLVLEAAAQGDAAIVVDGTEDTRRIIPRLGFRKRLTIDRVFKVLRPWSFIRRGSTRDRMARNAGKLSMFWGSSVRSRFSPLGTRPAGFSANRVHMVEVEGRLTGQSWDALQHIDLPPGGVLRNTLHSEFMNWYRQCPRGDVRLLRALVADRIVGQATIMLSSGRGHVSATILNVEAWTDETAWNRILDGIERYAQEKGATHMNAFASYGPWRKALSSRGYCRLKTVPFWVRDESNHLAHIDQWHITAIEGDLGYLFE